MGSVGAVSFNNKLRVPDTDLYMSYFKCRFFYLGIEKLCNHYEKQLVVVSTSSI